MKFLITESKLEQIIFKYLDNQDFIIIDKNDKIYFSYSKDDVYAQIKYNKDGDWCGVYYKLIEEISSLFSLNEYESKKVIGKWVENTLQMEVLNISKVKMNLPPLVENTLQMEVLNIIWH